MDTKYFFDQAKDFIGRNNIPNITLYHYCSQKAMLSIVENEELWLGCAANMNDTQELRYFIDGVKKCILSTIFKDKQEYCDTIFENINYRLREEYPFVFCLSELRDNAAQWERYADSATGISMGFNTIKLVALLFESFLSFTKVVYGYNAFEHDICNVLREYIDNDRFIGGFSKLTGIIDNLLACAPKYKHDSFCSEQEWRICTLLKGFGYDYKKMNTGIIKKVATINLKELCLQRGIAFDDLFDSIIIGPRSKQSVEDLKGYLKKLGHNILSEKVVRSTCPLR